MGSFKTNFSSFQGAQIMVWCYVPPNVEIVHLNWINLKVNYIKLCSHIAQNQALKGRLFSLVVCRKRC